MPTAGGGRATATGSKRVQPAVMIDQVNVPTPTTSLPRLASHAVQPVEVAGIPDGPALTMPSGLKIQLHRVGDVTVPREVVREAVRGVLLLPEADQRLVASAGIPIELIPVTQLEQVPGTTRPVVGATRVVGPDGSARAERLRIAAFQALHGSSVVECVQHEIGHVVGVTRSQDLGEPFAEQYAARY